VSRRRCILMITKDARGSDSDQGNESDLSDHDDHDNHDSDCRYSVIQVSRDGGS